LNTRQAYELWAATYPPIAHNPVMRAEQSTVEPLLRRVQARRALDVGTGSGRYLPILSASGAAVVGLDFSWAMLSMCRHRRVCGDARRLPFHGESFDLINASLIVGDLADLCGWASEISRVLQPGGHVIYSDFHPVWGEYGWRRTFTAANGERHEVAIEAHTIGQHITALAGAGLTVRTIREPHLLAERDRAVETFRKRWGDPPLLVVVHASKEP